MKFKFVVKFLAPGLAICLLLALVAGWGIMIDIQRSVDKYVRVAQKAHAEAGNGVESLIEFIKYSEHTIAEKDRAAWALGQIADKRAKDFLLKYYTGEKCEHGKKLCQYELKKALRRCD